MECLSCQTRAHARGKSRLSALRSLVLEALALAELRSIGGLISILVALA